MLEDSYQGLFSDSYKSLQENANIFDFDKLKLRKSLSTSHATPLPQANSLGSGPGGFLECLKAPPLPSKATRGATMESRFRLSSISETEELLKMR
jgi:hypothetical protein